MEVFLSDLTVSNYQIHDLANGTASGDAVNKSQLDTKLNLSGGVMSGNITFNSTQLFNAANLNIASQAIGDMLYANAASGSGAWLRLAVGTSTQLLHGGSSPTWGPLVTADFPASGVVSGSYGSASQVATFTVDSTGRLTAASNVSIAIAASQVTSGILPIARGGTNNSAYTTNGVVYYNGTSLVTSSSLTYNGTTVAISADLSVTNNTGIKLSSADRPLITRGWDAFTSGNYNTLGRWGIFMESSQLALGVPNVSGKSVAIRFYNVDSSTGSTPYTWDLSGYVSTLPHNIYESVSVYYGGWSSTSSNKSALSSAMVYNPSGNASGRVWGLFFGANGTGSFNLTDGWALNGMEGNAGWSGSGSCEGANGVLAYCYNNGTGALNYAYGMHVIGFADNAGSGGHIHHVYGVKVNLYSPAFSANNQIRAGVWIDGIPNPGVYTGVTAIALAIEGTSRTTRDGIRIAGDSYLYSSAASTLKTDGAFVVGTTLTLGAPTTTRQQLKFTSGTILTTPVAGVMEYDGSLYFTDSVGRKKIKLRNTASITLMAGYTPSGTGADKVFKLPRVNGASVTWTVKRVIVRVETPSAGTSTFQVEKYTGTGAFSGTNILSSALSISGGSTYESSTSSFATPTLTSDDKVRVNFSALDSTHADFTIELELEEA